jgi:hypothetical protein
MGRIVDLCGEIAAESEEGPEGLVLSPDGWDRLRRDWSEEDIEDAMGLVRDSLLLGELVDAADSLSARLLDVLGDFGSEAAFKEAADGRGKVTLEAIGQIARRVDRLEEILEVYREGTPPERHGFDLLRRRLADHGIEAEMEAADEREDREREEDGDKD